MPKDGWHTQAMAVRPWWHDPGVGDREGRFVRTRGQELPPDSFVGRAREVEAESPERALAVLPPRFRAGSRVHTGETLTI